jgi:iron complex transport system ATP-binding protein
MSEMSERQIAQKISVVLTEPVRIPYMTVNNLVAYGRYPHVKEQLSMTQEDTDIIECAMKDTGVFSLKERQLMSLSDGERQKAVLARAIAQQTNIILLDEPAAFLDFPSKIELMQLLGRFARNDAKTILLSTHDIEMASAIADELWVIDNQNNIITGAPKKLLDNRILSETFDISQNFLQQMFVQYQALYRNFI